MKLFKPHTEGGDRDHRPLILGLSTVGLSLWAAFQSVWRPEIDDLQRWAQYLPFRCPLKLFTGLECPLCGLGRSLLSLSTGNWKGAWDFHPLGPFLSLSALLMLIFYLTSPRTFLSSFAKLNQVWQGFNPRLKKRALTFALLILIAQTLALNADHLSTISP
jgi:hypothetical protein